MGKDEQMFAMGRRRHEPAIKPPTASGRPVWPAGCPSLSYRFFGCSVETNPIGLGAGAVRVGLWV